MIRNLATMTRVGVLEPGSAARRRWSTGWATRSASVGRGCTRSPCSRPCARTRRAAAPAAATWSPVRAVVDALDGAFYSAFGNVEPAGTRLLLALDVSGSMTAG